VDTFVKLCVLYLVAICRCTTDETVKTFQIYFHGRNYNSLLTHIDEKCLPKKYGGKMDNLQFDRMDFYELLHNYQDDFERESPKAVADKPFLYLCCRDGALR
jgi:hypothetical protein